MDQIQDRTESGVFQWCGENPELTCLLMFLEGGMEGTVRHDGQGSASFLEHTPKPVHGHGLIVLLCAAHPPP